MILFSLVRLCALGALNVFLERVQNKNDGNDTIHVDLCVLTRIRSALSVRSCTDSIQPWRTGRAPHDKFSNQWPRNQTTESAARRRRIEVYRACLGIMRICGRLEGPAVGGPPRSYTPSRRRSTSCLNSRLRSSMHREGFFSSPVVTCAIRCSKVRFVFNSAARCTVVEVRCCSQKSATDIGCTSVCTTTKDLSQKLNEVQDFECTQRQIPSSCAIYTRLFGMFSGIQPRMGFSTFSGCRSKSSIDFDTQVVARLVDAGFGIRPPHDRR